MDPILIDPIAQLGSVTGIVGLTITIVHALKVRLGHVDRMRDLPVWAYALTVSLTLTWVAHSILGVLEGDLLTLVAQAVVQVLIASGAIELARAGNKPLKDTSAAIDAELEQRWTQGRRKDG